MDVLHYKMCLKKNTHSRDEEGKEEAEIASKAGGLEMISHILIMQKFNGLMIFLLHMARNFYFSLLSSCLLSDT